MKKLTTLFGALLLASLTLSSCGNSIESDAQRVADVACKVSTVMEKAMQGDEDAKEESEKLSEEMKSLKEEMEGKYTTEADQEEFKKAVTKATKDCK
jgi:predicted small secreted protein